MKKTSREIILNSIKDNLVELEELIVECNEYYYGDECSRDCNEESELTDYEYDRLTEAAMKLSIILGEEKDKGCYSFLRYSNINNKII